MNIQKINSVSNTNNQTKHNFKYDLNTKSKTDYSEKNIENIVNITVITWLVSMISNIKINKEAEKELILTYYESLEIRKQDGFTSREITVKNRPNLYNYLLENELLLVSKNHKEIINHKKRILSNR